MARNVYRPPEQGRAGQVFDSVFLLLLVYLVLFMPLIFGLTGQATTTRVVENPTWEALGQNEVAAGQWEKLGFTPESASELITTRFDYVINPLSLLLTAVVILGYFLFVIRMSDKEYRDVIAERFDGDGRDGGGRR
ncbi:MAG: hypothetical protein KDG89_02665 [Geminicoccaceae bacterium]|nr:hypothetical protein [Geminicoccaceae bacterium]